MTWINSKVNDVQATEDLTKLKDEAVNRGFARMQVSQAIHKCRKIIDESNANKQNAEPPKQEPTPEPTPPSPTKVDVTQGASQGVRRDLSSLPTQPGLNPSGGKVRQSKVSILDMADNKRAEK